VCSSDLALGVVAALGYREVAAVIGHDFGSPVAAWCALTRPDVFRRVALMSAPFAGGPDWPKPGQQSSGSSAMPGLDEALAALPRPRKHYHAYYATRPANADMMGAAQGLHAFMRAYYHHKSADWAANKPHRLRDWSAEEMAKLPTYYVMDRAETMPETVAHEMPSAAEVACCAWLTEAEMAVYAAEYGRTGFQGGLNWYRNGHNQSNVQLCGLPWIRKILCKVFLLILLNQFELFSPALPLTSKTNLVLTSFTTSKN
jgi:pimeloyl-ACP methyl ester carboxylesterase